jgi:flavorubredoxin
MSPYPAAALESAAGTTVYINALNKKSVANVSVNARAQRPAALKTIMPGHRALAAPMRDIKADWKRWNRAERISAVSIIATIVYGLTLVEAFAG